MEISTHRYTYIPYVLGTWYWYKHVPDVTIKFFYHVWLRRWRRRRRRTEMRHWGGEKSSIAPRQSQAGSERRGVWNSTNTHSHRARNICDFTIIKSIWH